MFLGLFQKNDPSSKYRTNIAKPNAPPRYPVRKPGPRNPTNIKIPLATNLKYLTKRYLDEKLGTKANLNMNFNQIKKGELLRRLELLSSKNNLLKLFKKQMVNMSTHNLFVMFDYHYKTFNEKNYIGFMQELHKMIHHLKVSHLQNVLAKAAVNQSTPNRARRR